MCQDLERWKIDSSPETAPSMELSLTIYLGLSFEP